MCFSSHASFGAAIALSGIGWISLRNAATRRHLPFAAIPLFFAAQQACEGCLWLTLEHATFGKSDTPIARVFLFFAFTVWPAYLPASLALIERKPWRRLALVLWAMAGAVLGGYLMGCASLRASDACIAYANIYYWVQLDSAFKPMAPFAYLASVAAPFGISSVRGAGWLGFAIVASFSVVGLVYRAGFISVWCFVASLLSGAVAVIAGRSCRAQLADHATN